MSILHSMKTMSCPKSPIESFLLHSKSPQNLGGRMSPSSMSGPHTESGSSILLTSGCGAVPFYHAKQPTTCLQESIGMTYFKILMMPRSLPSEIPSAPQIKYVTAVI